jgi:hypothetical protein
VVLAWLGLLQSIPGICQHNVHTREAARPPLLGTAAEERPASAKDFMATVCNLLGINPARMNLAQGRPIRTVERDANPIAGLR